MPETLMVGVNVIQIQLEFNGVKSCSGDFTNQEGRLVSFTTKPAIQLTLDATASAPPYLMSFNKTGNLYTGVTVKFQQAYTGIVYALVTGV